ncbi:MAG TPA: isoprenylcysteine carboxylmethyltransferase family protein [Candidatus Acidoferrum sp.]|nr:isoprenylcysteine carboxylmethyltransferase family protein [Candidatus Acidoferrum sp.]
MVGLDAATVIDAAWIVFLVYWFAAAFRLNRMKKREPASEWLLRFVVMGTAFVLLDGSLVQFGDLNKRFFPHSAPVQAVGAALTCLGVAFAIWARYHIGRYWSSTVSLRADHQLIRTGPYAHIRHPIYTGILLAVLGTAVAVGRYRAIVAFVIVLAGFTWKASREEALLSGEFGPAFEEHKRVTGFFLPRFS